MNIDKIVVSNKFKHRDKGLKCYTDDNIIRTLSIALPQMSGYIKYFGNNGKNMSFVTEDYIVLTKYNEIWNKTKKN